MNYYFCDACRYCFSAEKLPDRCPDCGAVAHNNKKAVRPASKTEIEELLKIQKEDKEDTLCLTVFDIACHHSPDTHGLP